LEDKENYLLITRYLSQQTSTEENEYLADWISATAANEQIFYEIKHVWLLSKPGVRPDSDTALNKLKQKIAQTEDHVVVKQISPAKWYALAASVTALIILLIHARYNQYQPDQQVIHQVTKAGQKKKVRLDDGTIVHLAPQSSLSYPLALNKNKRLVELKGEAYFEVAKSPHRPFVVHTTDMDVAVLGTHFNVRSYKSNILSTVSLLEGKVKVILPGDGEKDDYLLKPGQELSYNHHNHRVYQHKFDAEQVTAWMSNKLIFKNDRLADAADKIETIYGIKIVFADQATADTRLYASFENESLVNVLETIKTAGNVAYTIAGNRVYLTLHQ
jgi:transmembrane sensor